jgi:multicomponent Na+:H+ antiporter subunit B
VSRTARLVLFAVAAGGFGVVLVYGLAGLPAFGHYQGVYGNVLDGLGVTERHATDLVTGLNFDFRGFDTLGEEFILFGSVLGVVLILREMRGEQERPSQHEADEHTFAGASEALRALSLAMIPAILAIGVYTVVHGQLTPGGGFQGGVVLAAGPLAVFLAGRYLRMRIVAPHTLVEIGEAAGALGYALVGLAGLVISGIFFKNFVPLGTVGHLLSGGQLDIASTAVGLEVSGAFLVAFSEFLDQAIAVSSGGSET